MNAGERRQHVKLIAAAQQFARLLNVLSNLFNICQPPNIRFERLIFLRLKIGVGDLFFLPTEHVETLLILLSGELFIFEGFFLRLPSVIDFAVIVERVLSINRAVDQIENGIVAKERKIIILTVHVDKRLTQAFQRRQCNVSAVDDDRIFGVARDFAGDYESAVVGVDVEIG